MYTKVKYGFFALVLFFSYSSCSSDFVDTSDNQVDNSDILLRLGDVSENIRQYTEVYAFYREVAKRNLFSHKPLNIERTTDHLKMDMPVGQWNLTLVGCNEMDIRPYLLAPSFGNLRSSSPMWKTQASNGLLPDVPEIRTALVNNITILRDQNTQAAASLERNVAKIRVAFKDAVGFKVGEGHTISLLNVPTTLSWDGYLYPDGRNPTTSDLPMTKNFTFLNSTTQAHQYSDYVEFIIPANKNINGVFNSNKISVAVKLITLGGVEYINTVEIPIVPQANTIMEVNLTSRAGIEVNVEVADWTWDSYDLNIFSGQYVILAAGVTNRIQSFNVVVKQERNWWVTLDDTVNYEFVDESVTFGNITESTIIQVRKKPTSNTTVNTRVRLNVEGLEGTGYYCSTNIY